MEKSCNKTWCGKYNDKKRYSYKAKRRSTSDPSSESDEDTKSHHNRSRVHKHQHHHSRSSVNKSVGTQSIEYDGERCSSKEERVAWEPDKKRRRSYGEKHKAKSQKESCNSEDESEQLEFSFQKYY